MIRIARLGIDFLSKSGWFRESLPTFGSFWRECIISPVSRPSPKSSMKFLLVLNSYQTIVIKKFTFKSLIKRFFLQFDQQQPSAEHTSTARREIRTFERDSHKCYSVGKWQCARILFHNASCGVCTEWRVLIFVFDIRFSEQSISADASVGCAVRQSARFLGVSFQIFHLNPIKSGTVSFDSCIKEVVICECLSSEINKNGRLVNPFSFVFIDFFRTVSDSSQWKLIGFFLFW